MFPVGDSFGDIADDARTPEVLAKDGRAKVDAVGDYRCVCRTRHDRQLHVGTLGEDEAKAEVSGAARVPERRVSPIEDANRAKTNDEAA
jgi:hypothetical protein